MHVLVSATADSLAAAAQVLHRDLERGYWDDDTDFEDKAYRVAGAFSRAAKAEGAARLEHDDVEPVLEVLELDNDAAGPLRPVIEAMNATLADQHDS